MSRVIIIRSHHCSYVGGLFSYRWSYVFAWSVCWSVIDMLIDLELFLKMADSLDMPLGWVRWAQGTTYLGVQIPLGNGKICGEMELSSVLRRMWHRDHAKMAEPIELPVIGMVSGWAQWVLARPPCTLKAAVSEWSCSPGKFLSMFTYAVFVIKPIQSLFFYRWPCSYTHQKFPKGGGRPLPGREGVFPLAQT